MRGVWSGGANVAHLHDLRRNMTAAHPSQHPLSRWRAPLPVNTRVGTLPKCRAINAREGSKRGRGTHQDPLKSATSSKRQLRIGQCAGKRTTERMARGHEMNMVTSDVCTVRAPWG